jgi:hypothetical protein
MQEMIEVSGVFNIAPVRKPLIFSSKHHRHTILRIDGNRKSHFIVIDTVRRRFSVSFYIAIGTPSAAISYARDLFQADTTR